MGAKDRIYGSIFIDIGTGNSPGHKEKVADLLWALESLPLEDEYPFFTRNLFSVTASRYPMPGVYKEVVVHFGLTIKDVANDWDVWLDKFESFLEMFEWKEARLHLELELPVNGAGSIFSYSWKMPSSGEHTRARGAWHFEGGPREFGEVVSHCRALAVALKTKLLVDPKDVSALQGLMQCLARLRRQDEFNECLLRLEEIDPKAAKDAVQRAWGDRYLKLR